MRATGRTWTLATVVAASVLAGSVGMSSAMGQPIAGAAAANTMIATIANVTPPDTNYVKYVRVTGQVTAATKKYGPRNCKANRTIDVTSPTVGGRIGEVGSSYPTGKSGAFRVEFPIEYASYQSDGTFIDGYVRDTGGTATFTLSTDKHKVQKVKGDPFRTYTCRPLLLTVQITVPPIPGA